MNTPTNPSGVEAAVCEDIAKRQQLGIGKYGGTVADNPAGLREWLQHAYEECLDQAVYLKRAMVEIDRNATSPSDATACSAGSLLRCYWAFLEYFPWKKSEFPTYDLWICSDADDARIFRQGWAARCRTLESLPNDKADPLHGRGKTQPEKQDAES